MCPHCEGLNALHQNVKFEKTCEAPFVRIIALRDIAAGEELPVDGGPNCRDDFMQDPEVIRFFEGLRASGPRRHGYENLVRR